MKQCWADVQAGVAECTRCESKLPDVDVHCPPGLLYPAGIVPPSPIRVLFVGVAPPENGRHFYTPQSDNLRRGLLAVLQDLGRPCGDVHDFIARGFFLVHTAKCAIRDTTAPDLRVSKFCASQHLRKEVECLLPDGLCFLNKNIGFPVCHDLAGEWDPTVQVAFGQPTTLVICDRPVEVVATAWPGRGREAITRQHVQSFFCRLGLPSWR